MKTSAIQETVPAAPVVERLAFTREELCASLGVSETTLWRIEARGMIRSVPGIRRKLYSVESVRAFLAGKAAA